MSRSLHFKFDPNQDFQQQAIAAVVDLLDGYPRRKTDEFLSQEIVANLGRHEDFERRWLAGNLRSVQTRNAIPRASLLEELWQDEGLMLEGVADDAHSCPHFTVEMETGTGKTYVYLRTLYELFARYGFRKFIIVVPSVAIYQGVLKTFEVTRSHFSQLYQGTYVVPIAYDGEQLSKLRDYATSTLPSCLIMTLDSFNKRSNTLYKPSEKLPGERLPFEYIRETRPIIVLDEPQNMESETSRMALRTLTPLFVLRYSATHKSSPNLVYRLTPFEAFRRGLVKRIQVDAVTERDNLNAALFELRAISDDLRATIRTRVSSAGQTQPRDVVLKQGDHLYDKTERDEHRGFVVQEINRSQGFIAFEDGTRIHLSDSQALSLSQAAIFRLQIRATIERHLAHQASLDERGLHVKVLSLFFIDRVANYTAAEGIIRRIFDEEFTRLKSMHPRFVKFTAEEARQAYFAKNRDSKTQTEEAIDTEGRNAKEREAERAAFQLIMRDKERLLSFDEPVAFIFAHSALKEGWDNPNVFQICTLNQARSEVRKRQEIGRGLRLCVDQQGDRLFDESVNILTVVANESYSAYVSGLQTEYQTDELEAPPKPTQVKKATAHRNDAHFTHEAFTDFWRRLTRRTRYSLRIDSARLIERCCERLNNATYPTALLVVESGEFVMTQIRLTLREITPKQVKIQIQHSDTNGNSANLSYMFKPNEDLSKSSGIQFLRGYKIMEINGAGQPPSVLLTNGVRLVQGITHEFQRESLGQRPHRATQSPQEAYPVFDLIGRAVAETDLTRPTVQAIFDGLRPRVHEKLLSNPEGFANVFIGIIRDELARHVVEELRFEVLPDAVDWELEALFPQERQYPQRELIEAGERGLYDQVQKDSDVEERFVLHHLKDNERVLFYFKFPPAFKVSLPRIIGNYNPDWGIVYQKTSGEVYLQLVRETKGNSDINRLRFASEGRKILAASKHFAALGIDYRHITDGTADWWEQGPHQPPIPYAEPSEQPRDEE